MSERRLGRHIGISTGMVPSLRAAHEAGYNAAQVFPGNPKGWYHAPLAPAAAAETQNEARALDVVPLVIHAPYIINIATSDPALAANSRRSLRHALDRAREIGARYVVVHAGSHKGEGEEGGIARAASLIGGLLPSTSDGARVLIENSAGAGNALAGSPEALGRLVKALPSAVGACIDTAHLWGSECDLSTSEGVEDALERLDHHVGLDRIPVIHLNDSAVALSSKRDVHAHLGDGMIGLAGLAALASHAALRDKPIILETPGEDEPEREANRCRLAWLVVQGDAEGAQAILTELGRLEDHATLVTRDPPTR